jgi:hypothetical protein
LTTENAVERELGERGEAFGLASACNRRNHAAWRFINECAGL